jgi:phage gp45-like
MHRATPVNTSFRAYVGSGSRCLIDKTDDEKEMQECTAQFMKAEERERIECPQNYGFTSNVVKAEKEDDGQIKKCAEGFVQFMGGNRSFPVVEVMDDRRYRLKNMEEGEVAVYDDQQQSVKVKRKEIQSRSQKRITLRLIKDEDQHKEDAERDQQKHKDKPLSSMMFDKDTIEIIRTKDDGQLAAKKDEEDKKGTMKSRMFLTKGDDKEKDKIIIETPEVHLTIDEKAKSFEIDVDKDDGQIVIKTETLSITLNETKKTIQLKTETLSATLDEINKTIKLKTQSVGVTLHNNSGYVIAGDGVSGYQAARMGSLTSKGDVIVGRVATKVLVL